MREDEAAEALLAHPVDEGEELAARRREALADVGRPDLRARARADELRGREPDRPEDGAHGQAVEPGARRDARRLPAFELSERLDE